ncbi:hypothetical protein [Nonomuraea dietziae]|uniref:hypothetical protein n=1 Tax=Nonomuraea dietziae TaxID=65515 RepID=UPI0031D38A4E
MSASTVVMRSMTSSSGNSVWSMSSMAPSTQSIVLTPRTLPPRPAAVSARGVRRRSARWGPDPGGRRAGSA